jgi:8-oxo-dGTP diphosphatase
MVQFPPSYCPTCGATLSAEDGPRYECPECGETVFHSPSIATQVAVVERSSAGNASSSDAPESRVLLGERGTAPGEGRFTTPGGHIDLWEEPRRAAVRELREETGLRAVPEELALLDVRDLSATVPYPGLTDEKQVICVDYGILWEAVEGQPAPADDLAAVRWASESSLDAIEWAYEDDRLICREAIRAFDSNDSS